MKNDERNISDHYTTSDLGNRILAALEAAGKDLGALTVDDLAAVDAFHIRGRKATDELVQWTAIRPGQVVLDVGCGLGGTSRHLASTTGCRVTGIDLTEEYCRVAEMLSSRVGLDGQTVFRQGSALDLPFDDHQFDIVWTEHVQMNVEDKGAFYAEIARVLKPGGQFAFHDIFAGSRDGVRFPVPWASNGSLNHLADIEEIRERLIELGLAQVRWEERTGDSARFFRGVMKSIRTTGWNPLGLHLLMGDDAETKFDNLLRNLEEERVKVVQAVMKRGAPTAR